MRYIIAINPSDFHTANIFSRYDDLTPAHTGFSVRSDGHLYAADQAASIHGGLLFITFEGMPSNRGCERLASEISFVYRRAGASGIVINGYEDMNADNLIGLLNRRLGAKIYISSEVKSDAGCIRIVSTAVSGGTLSDMLSGYVSKYGADNIAAAAELVRSDFTLPAFSGSGRELSLSDTQELIQKYRTPSFYSTELETNYFNYRKDGNLHMVLYDNGRSLKRKISLAQSLGISECFLSYSETKSIIENIID